MLYLRLVSVFLNFEAVLHFAAGLSTGVVSAFLLQPFDLIKTRLQQPGPGSISASVRTILQKPEGVLGLWRGTFPSVCRTGFGAALYFSTLNTLRSHVAHIQAQPRKYKADFHDGEANYQSSSLPQLTHLGNLITGAVARASVGFIMMPVTIIKVRYESSMYSYSSIADATRSIWYREGMQGFFRGYGATALRDAPCAGLYVVFYEQCKRRLGNGYGTYHQGKATPGFWSDTTRRSISINLAASALAAGIATTLTNPFDVLKTRIQVMPKRHVGMLETVRYVIREDGAKSLLDGLGLRIGRKAVSAAMTWTAYEEIVKYFARSLPSLK